MIEKIPDMRPIRAVSGLTGLSYDHLRKLCLKGKIVHIRVGHGKFLINVDRLIEYLNTAKGGDEE